jgi:opacity protein-like surface antigen
MKWRAALALAAWSLTATPCAAQVTIGGGLLWSAGHDTGVSTADLRSNATGTAVPPFTWFQADSRLGAAPGFEGRVGVDVTPSFTIEGGASYARPRLSFAISRDAESTSQEYEGASLHQYVFDGAVLWRLPMERSPRVRPFVVGGVGYLRQLHEERTLVESGQLYFAGGGARFWLRGSATSSRSLGLRTDVRVNIRRRGADFENAVRVYPTVSALFFVGL